MIDKLVDFIVGHELLSFLNAFFRYNQTEMAAPNKEKTYFYHK